MAFLLIGIGGFIGSISRYSASLWIRSLYPGEFPLGTFLINLFGSTLIGFLHHAFRDHPLQPTITLLVGVGFLGGFTTFSSFSLETWNLFQRGNPFLAYTYAILSLTLCILGAGLGTKLALFVK